MKIGDFVCEYVGGPIMRIVGFLNACRVAVCQALHSGVIKYVAVVLLVAAGGANRIAQGDAPEDDPPFRPVVECQADGSAINSSGLAINPTFPPRPIIARQIDDGAM